MLVYPQLHVGNNNNITCLHCAFTHMHTFDFINDVSGY